MFELCHNTLNYLLPSIFHLQLARMLGLVLNVVVDPLQAGTASTDEIIQVCFKGSYLCGFYYL